MEGPYKFDKYQKDLHKWVIDKLNDFAKKTNSAVFYLFIFPVISLLAVVSLGIGVLWLLSRQEKFVLNYVDWLDKQLSGFEDESFGKMTSIGFMLIISIVPLILYAGPAALYGWVKKKIKGEEPQEEEGDTPDSEETLENLLEDIFNEERVDFKQKSFKTNIKKHTFK
jgi:hypothetical protein